jgi:hypothetical protein
MKCDFPPTQYASLETWLVLPSIAMETEIREVA